MMSAEFEARQHLGKLYDQHLQDGQGVFWDAVNIGGIRFDLKIEKWTSPTPSIEMRIYSLDLIYRYTYRGNLSAPFDLKKLDPLLPIRKDD